MATSTPDRLLHAASSAGCPRDWPASAFPAASGFHPFRSVQSLPNSFRSIPAQSKVMYDALREKGLTTALVMFEGEQHGFRQAANIR